MTYRVRNIVVAAVLAALAGAMTLVYVVNYKRHVQSGEDKVNVLVAARDIPAGTTGSEVVEQHMLKTEAVPKRTLVPGWLGDSDKLQNLVAVQDVYAEEQVTTRRFARPQEQGIRAQLKGNDRGMQLGGDPNQVLAGTLKTGDHVDFVATWAGKSRIVVRDAYVLKAPDAVDASKLGPTEQASVQLRLTDIQAQKVKYILELGEHDEQGRSWHLLLRPPAKSTDSPNTFQNSRSMEKDNAGIRRP